MSFIKLSNRPTVDILFGGDHVMNLHSLAAPLRSAGFCSVHIASDQEMLAQNISRADLDLLILSVSTNFDSFDFVKKIRWGRVGTNPFLLIILIVDSPKPSDLEQLLGCGADEILLRASAHEFILQRIDTLATKRKPFIANDNYLGPERRARKTNFPTVYDFPVHVPNTLRARLEGFPLSDSELSNAVLKAQTLLAEQMLRANVRWLGRFALRAEQLAKSGSTDTELISMLEQHRSLCRKFIALCDEADLLDEMRILIRLMSLAFVIARKLPEVSKPDYEQLVAITGSFDIAVSSQAKILSLVSVPHFLARYQPKSLCPESESSATNLIPLLK